MTYCPSELSTSIRWISPPTYPQFGWSFGIRRILRRSLLYRSDLRVVERPIGGVCVNAVTEPAVDQCVLVVSEDAFDRGDLVLDSAYTVEQREEVRRV